MPNRQIFASAIGDIDTSARDIVGSIRWENGKAYKYVKVSGGTTISGISGDPVCYKAGASTSTFNSTDAVVSLDLTDGDAQPVLAGFLCNTTSYSFTASTSFYTWIQIRGQVTVPAAVTSGVIGSGCMLGTAAGGTDKTLIVATGVINPGAVLLSTSGANNRVAADCLA